MSTGVACFARSLGNDMDHRTTPAAPASPRLTRPRLHLGALGQREKRYSTKRTQQVLESNEPHI